MAGGRWTTRQSELSEHTVLSLPNSSELERWVRYRVRGPILTILFAAALYGAWRAWNNRSKRQQRSQGDSATPSQAQS